MAEPVLVDNASDADQVAYAKRVEVRREDRRFGLVRAQLSTSQGREFAWDELQAYGVFDVLDGPLELVYAANAVANLGRRRLVEYQTQHADLYLLMQQEAIVRARRDRDEIEAAKLRKGRRTEDRIE